MGKNRAQGYIYATIMGVLTAINCLAIADGYEKIKKQKQRGISE